MRNLVPIFVYVYEKLIWKSGEIRAGSGGSIGLGKKGMNKTVVNGPQVTKVSFLISKAFIGNYW